MLGWLVIIAAVIALFALVILGNVLVLGPLLTRGYRPWRRRPPLVLVRKGLVGDKSVSIPTRVLVGVPSPVRNVDRMLVGTDRLVFLAAGGTFEVHRSEITTLTVVDWFGIGWGRGFLISSAAGTWDGVAAFPLNADAALATLATDGWPIDGVVTAVPKPGAD